MEPADSNRTRNRLLSAIGLLLLVLWAIGWAVSTSQNCLVNKNSMYFPVYRQLGCDFDCNYFAVKRWFEGGNPYKGYTKGPYPEGGPGTSQQLCDYPPIVLPLFAWCGVLSRETAMLVWLTAQSATFAFAGFFCWRYRTRLGLTNVPLPLALAATLLSYPVLFEMERGNCNSYSLLFMVLGVWALEEKTARRDALGGTFIAVATWIKMYPGIMFFGLLAMRRWRAAAWCAVAGLAIGLAGLPSVIDFKNNIKVTQLGITPDNLNTHFGHAHSLTGSWKLVCNDLGLTPLARLKPAMGSALVIGPLILLVSYRVFRASRSMNIIYPYLLWLIAAGTYLPGVGNDYNLIFLPLAALAAWDKRDGMWTHFFMASALFWWQPISLGVDEKTLFYSKLVGLAVVGRIVVARANEQARLAMKRSESDTVQPPATRLSAAA